MIADVFPLTLASRSRRQRWHCWHLSHSGPLSRAVSQQIACPDSGAPPPGKAGRNRYADLLRVSAISAVVVGHWLLTDVTYQDGQLSGLDSLKYISWGRWVTLFMQVMPVFFLVGGYVNARSWAAHHDRGEGWADWVRERAMRLLWPTTVYVAVAIVAVAGARTAGVSAAELARAGWLVAFQLWFLPVYLLLIALTPVLLAAHRRWGLALPAAMAVAAAAVDVAVIGFHLPLIGFANYVLVWGSMHQWGFAWQDGTLTRARWRPYALAAGGGAVLVGLLVWGPFPVDMIGAGERIGNTTPPSIALLALAACQTGLVIAAEPAVSRLLAQPRRWRLVTRYNSTVMTVYLWHMVPVVIVAAALYTSGVIPQPATGSAQWWETRPVWLAVLALILVPLVLVVMWAERPMLRLPAGLGSPGRWAGMILLLGVATAAVGLARLAIAGFAPDGAVPLPALAAYGLGVIGTLLSGRPPSRGAPQTPAPRPRPSLEMPAGELSQPAGPVAEPQSGFGSHVRHRSIWSCRRTLAWRLEISRPDGSAQLLDADQVARGIAECAVANPVRLLGRLLDDLGSAGLHLLEGAVEVIGGQQDPAIGALGHHLGDGAALVVGDPRVGGRRRQQYGRAGLAGGADRDPAHLAVSDVAADLEAESVAVEGQGGVRVVVREEASVNGDAHGDQASCGSVTRASRFLTGLVTCFATHDGIPAAATVAWRR